MICQATGIYVVNPELSCYSLYPNFSNGLHLEALSETFGQAFHIEAGSVRVADFILVVFAFLFVDLFDTLGTLIGVASKSNMLDKDGKLSKIKGALLADSLATCTGAVLGTSTTTTYVESSSGVSEGGRTGLTALTTAILFFLVIFFSPIFVAIPSFATAPALITVGFYMIGAVAKINFKICPKQSLLSFLLLLCHSCISIAEGIALGVISYTSINILSGKTKEKKVSILMYILTVFFITKYIIMAIL